MSLNEKIFSNLEYRIDIFDPNLDPKFFVVHLSDSITLIFNYLSS